MKKVYSIYDKAAQAYTSPFFLVTDAQAYRAFETEAQNQQSNIGKYPDDYVLHKVGEFDEISGLFDTHEPERMISAREILAKPETTQEA